MVDDAAAPANGRERGLVRHRLFRMLERAEVAIVVAPAGSGKTTLLQQFSDRSGAVVTWHRVDAEDLDLGALPDAMVAAPHDRDSVVIVDDFQAIVMSPAEAEIERLIARRGARTKVVIASRQRPSMNVSRAEFGTVAVVGADDLRFRSWEAEDLFRQVYRDPLSPQAAAALTRHTEGWAAGLHMFHLSTRGDGGRDRRNAIEALSGRSRVLQSYLARTVVGELPSDLQQFLRGSCVFETLTADLCDRLLDRSDSRAKLVELERLQALTTSDDGGRTFRFHEILRTHLVAALHEELGAGGVVEWYSKAASLVEAEGSVAQAVRLYARANRWSDVARLLRCGGSRLAAVSENAPQWCDWLPGPIIDQDPWLSVAAARRLVASGRLRQAAERYRRAEGLFTDPTPRDHAARERRLVETWLDPTAQPGAHYVDRLRHAARRDPLATESPALTPGDVLGRAAALMLAGHVGAAQRLLQWSEQAPAATGWVALSIRFAELVLAGLAGEDIAEATDRLAGDAERIGVSLLARQCRGLAALLTCDGDGTRRVREECDAAGDDWGGVVAGAFDALGLLLAGKRAAAAWADTVSRCRLVGSETGQAWALAFGALAAAVERSPGAAADGRRAEAFARAAGVPGARVIALIALGSPAQARTVAAEIGMPWPGRLWRLLPEARPQTTTPVSVHERRVDLHLRCFEAFDIQVGDRALDWRALRPRAATTLRFLSIHAGRPVHRDLLLESLWPELSVAQARQNLQVTVSMLRRFLEPDSARGCAEILIRDGDAYRLVLHPHASADIVEFADALDDARKAQRAGDSGERRDALARAVHAYRGDLLPEDGAAEWVVGERERVRSRAAVAAATLAELDYAEGDLDAAATAAHRSLEIDPYLDQSWRLLIAVYERANDVAAAERCRREYHDVLVDLGLADLADAPLQGHDPGRRLRATA